MKEERRKMEGIEVERRGKDKKEEENEEKEQRGERWEEGEGGEGKVGRREAVGEREN